MRSICLAVTLFALACGSSSGPKETTPTDPQPMPAEKTLFERLGGLEAITAVTDEFLKNVTSDDRIKARFANMDAAAVADLRQKLIDQVCEATGGPCKYTGKNMVEAHTGMKITEDEFNALAEDMVKALDAKGVGAAEKDQLMAALASMKGDIVGK